MVLLRRGKNEPALDTKVIAPHPGGATLLAVWRFIRHCNPIAEGRRWGNSIAPAAHGAAADTETFARHP